MSVAGHLTASTTRDHPDIANSGINSSKSVNRYWTLTKDGSLAFNNCSKTFTFAAGDKDGGADYNSFIVAKKTSGAWSQPTVGTKTSTSTQATGITSFSDYQLGEQEGGEGGAEGVDIYGGATLRGGVTINQ
jgi:hypothetical protein